MESIGFLHDIQIGAASRIPGVTPAAVVRILFYMKSWQKQMKEPTITL